MSAAKVSQPSTYLKAILGGVGAGLAALAVAAQKDGVSAAEWYTAAGAAVGGFNLVFWPGNSNAKPDA